MYFPLFKLYQRSKKIRHPPAGDLFRGSLVLIRGSLIFRKMDKQRRIGCNRR